MILDLHVVSCGNCGRVHLTDADIPKDCKRARLLTTQINIAAGEWVRDNPDEMARMRHNLEKIEEKMLLQQRYGR